MASMLRRNEKVKDIFDELFISLFQTEPESPAVVRTEEKFLKGLC